MDMQVLFVCSGLVLGGIRWCHILGSEPSPRILLQCCCMFRSVPEHMDILLDFTTITIQQAHIIKKKSIPYA